MALPPRDSHPLVTVIMPIRNEEKFLARCLESVAATTYPAARLEILVMDGESTDRSREIAESFRGRLPGIKVLPNPKRLQAAAFNLALSQAAGDYVVRMDAHTLYSPEYIEVLVERLETTEAANVGGPQRSHGETALTEAIAYAVSSRFAAGDASYRYATADTWGDTVYLGAWRRSTLLELGGMRPDWAVNEDYEMNVRLRKRGGKILVTPAAKSTYFVRGSLGKLARQYFRYGFWKVRTLTIHPGSLRWRQLVAPGFVSYLALAWPLHRWVGALALVPAILYLGALSMLVVGGMRKLGMKGGLLAVIFPVIHLSWGSGFLCGLARWLPAARRSTGH